MVLHISFACRKKKEGGAARLQPPLPRPCSRARVVCVPPCPAQDAGAKGVVRGRVGKGGASVAVGAVVVVEEVFLLLSLFVFMYHIGYFLNFSK